MTIRDGLSNSQAVGALVPVVGTTNRVGVPQDLQGSYKNSVTFCIGASGDTLSGSVKMTCIIRESDSAASGFTPVDLSDLLYEVGTPNPSNGYWEAVIDDNAEDERVIKVSYIGSKRYIRPEVLFTGTHTNGTPVAIVVDLYKNQLPADNS